MLHKDRKVETLRSIIKDLGGKLFKVEFYKKDGTLRKMVCRTGVSVGVKGTAPEATAKRHETMLAKGMLTVWEMNTGSFKVVTLGRVTSFKCGDLDVTFEK